MAPSCAFAAARVSEAGAGGPTAARGRGGAQRGAAAGAVLWKHGVCLDEYPEEQVGGGGSDGLAGWPRAAAAAAAAAELSRVLVRAASPSLREGRLLLVASERRDPYTPRHPDDR